MKFIAALIVAFAFVFVGLSSPASAHRPVRVVETKCINKPCTVVQTRTCWTKSPVTYVNGEFHVGPVQRFCTAWSKPFRIGPVGPR